MVFFFRDTFKKIKSAFLLGFIALVLILTSGYWSAAIAKVVWNEFHSASLAIFFDGRNAELFFEIGNYYFNGGAYDLGLAEKAYKKVREIDPSYPRVYFQLGRIYFLRGHFQTARYFTNEELVLYPEFKHSYYLRGLINAYSDNFEQAERDFLSFLEFDSASWAAYNDLAFVYWKMGNYQLMKETVETGLSFSPNNSWLLSTLENALFNLGQYADALEIAERAEVSIENMTLSDWQKAYPGNNPNDAQKGINQMKGAVYFNKGLIYERLHQPANAILSFEKFITLNKDDLDTIIVEQKIALLKNQL